jgi:hypothetical protein
MRRTSHFVPDLDARLTAIIFLIILSREEFRVERPTAEERIDETAGNVRAFVAE